MGIFHSYVSLPEGNIDFKNPRQTMDPRLENDLH